MSIITVTGIGTDVGKTIVSAILVEALTADYWKPVQTGTDEGTDTDTIQRLVPAAICHAEAYRLSQPLSPHHAARLAGIQLKANEVKLPTTSRPLVIETAGGVMCPFYGSLLLLDVLTQWQSQWVIVSKNYLGSNNHTLMTVEVLRQRGLSILGIIFNGPSNPDSEDFILSYSGLPCLGRLAQETCIDSYTIKRYATQWKETLLAQKA